MRPSKSNRGETEFLGRKKLTHNKFSQLKQQEGTELFQSFWDTHQLKWQKSGNKIIAIKWF